jgi:hypothetical protein
VIEVLFVVAGEHELRGRRRHRRADVDEIELGVVARNHPGADVPPFVVGHVAPGLAAGLAGPRNRSAAPELFARARVVARDDAGVGAAAGLAVSPRDEHAVRNERCAALLHAMRAVIEDLGLPNLRAGLGIERIDEVVGAVVDDEAAVDREVPIRLRERHELAEILRQRSPVLPQLPPARSIERGRDVRRPRKIQHAVVHERDAFLRRRGVELGRPGEAQAAHVTAVDRRERAVAPAVGRASPHQPIGRIRIAKHGVGDGNDLGLR